MGIVGGNKPSTYSRSPELWNTWCHLTGFPGSFRAIDVDDLTELPDFLDSVWHNPDFVDLTITNPYKQPAFRWFEGRLGDPNVTVRPAAARLQAMNHLLRGPGGAPVIIANTDGAGLFRELPDSVRRTREALVVGAGGAARSIVDTLLENGISVTIANIVDPDARSLAQELSTAHRATRGRKVRLGTLPYEELAAGGADILERADLAILAITEGNPLSAEMLAPERDHLSVVDARYGKSAEGFLTADGAGLRAFDGRLMLFGQFAMAADTVAELHGIPGHEHRRALAEIRKRFLAPE